MRAYARGLRRRARQIEQILSRLPETERDRRELFEREWEGIAGKLGNLELAFAAQWAWLLYEIGRSTENKAILSLSRLIVPIIAVAEVFSWYACLTTNYIGSAIEIRNRYMQICYKRHNKWK